MSQSVKRPRSPTSPAAMAHALEDADGPEFADFIKISQRDDVFKLAGKIAWNARRDELRPLLATGPAAIATAAKAIAEARRYLGEDADTIELLCQPAFRDLEMRQSLAFYLARSLSRYTDLEDTSAQFTASKASKPPAVAGAIAGRARQGVGALITAIGDEAMCNALVAVCRARIYLEEDNMDIRFIPLVETVEKLGKDGEEAILSVLKLRVFVDKF